MRLIPTGMHGLLAHGAGAHRATLPWFFGSAGAVFLPHLLFGLLEIAAGLVTTMAPGRRHR